MNTLENKNLKNRYFGFFGSHSWAGTSVRILGDFADKMQFEKICNPIDMKQSLNQDAYEKAVIMGKNMADKILSDEEIVPNKTTDCE